MSGAHILYSASANKGRGAFFDPDVGYAAAYLPSDCVRIRRDRHAALLAGLGKGYQIVADKAGRPRLKMASSVDIEASKSRLIKAIKREAARRIDQRMPLWKQLNALRDGSDPGFHEVDAIRTASNLIEQQLVDLSSVDVASAFPVSNHPLWPQFDPTAAKD